MKAKKIGVTRQSIIKVKFLLFMACSVVLIPLLKQLASILSIIFLSLNFLIIPKNIFKQAFYSKATA
jgi:hypothetical protein